MRFRLRARWVFPVVGPPIENGVVTICGERIESVGPRKRHGRRRNRPGQRGDLAGLGERPYSLGIQFAGRTRSVTRGCQWSIGFAASSPTAAAGPTLNASRQSSPDWPECRRTGTTTIGEIATLQIVGGRNRSSGESDRVLGIARSLTRGRSTQIFKPRPTISPDRPQRTRGSV